MADGIEILHVDDDEDFGDLTAAYLERESDRFGVETATSGSEGMEVLTDGIDCVVSDYEMPGMNGIEFLSAVREDYPDVPFILFTGKGSEEIASEAISAGVTDYLRKRAGTEQYELLATRIETAVGQYRAEQELERQSDLFSKVQDLANVGAWEWNPQARDGHITEQVYEIYGIGPDYEGTPETDIKEFYHPEDREKIREAFQEAIETGEPYDVEVRVIDTDGTQRWVRTRGDPQFEDGTCTRIRGTIQDVTEHKRREQDFERSRERYRSLFEYNPLVIWEEDYSKAMQSVEYLADDIEDLETYLLANPNELDRLIGQIEVLDVNRTALEYYGAPSKDVLMNNLTDVFTEDGRMTFATVLDRFDRGDTNFRDETVARTLDGTRKHELLEIFVPDEYTDDYSRVYVTGMDITDRKNRNEQSRE